MDMAVLNGGSGYSHRIDSPARVVISLPFREDVTVANVNLSPSSVVKIDDNGFRSPQQVGNGKLYCGTSKCGYPYSYTEYGLEKILGTVGSVTPSAKLVSYEDEDLELAVAKDDQGSWVIQFPNNPPVRKSPGIIQVTWPTFTYPPCAPWATYGTTVGQPLAGSTPAGFASPYIFLDGQPSPYCDSGKWSIADRFAGGAALVCNQATTETYLDYADDPSLKNPSYKEKNYTPWGAYHSGKPLHPLREGIAFGKLWTDPLYYNKIYSPEYTYTRTIPELTQWITPFVTYTHYRPQSPAAMNTLVYSNNVGGGGLAAAGVWTLTGTDKSLDTYKLTYQITNGGSGYTYEPYILITTEALSPRQVGTSSEWSDVCCADYLSSGLLSGFPYSWGETGGQAPTPTPVGFGVDIQHSSDDAVFDDSQRMYGQNACSSSLLRPHTKGLFNSTVFFREKTDTYQYQSEYGFHYNYDYAARFLAPLSSSLGVGGGVVGFNSFSRVCMSSSFGMTKGMYSLDMNSVPSEVRRLLPGGETGYQQFVPFSYSRDLLLPIRMRSVGQQDYYETAPGNCYTRSPGDLGGGRVALLDAPSSFRKLFYHDKQLYAVSGENDLWMLSDNLRNPLIHPATQALDEQDKVPIKAWGAECEVEWSWKKDTTDVTVLTGDSNLYGLPTGSLYTFGTYSHTYLLPPEKKVKIDQGYRTVASVYPSASYKVVITDHGHGYKPDDTITFTLSNARFATISNAAPSFSYTSSKSETISVKVPAVEVDVLNQNGGSAGTRMTSYLLGNGSSYTGGISYTGSMRTTALGGLPYPRPYVGQWTQGNPVFKTANASATYLKSLSARLSHQFECKEVTAPDFVLGTWPILNSYCIRGGGVYMDDRNASNEVNQLSYSPSASGYDFVIPFYTRIPDVVISGGSGTGARAVLLPSSRPAFQNTYYNSSYNFRPYRLTEGLRNLDVALRDCSVKYGITTDGSLRSFDNPLAPPPDSYASGFDKAECNMGLTSSGDAYFLDHIGVGSPLQKPIAVQNVEYSVEDPGSNYTLWPLIKVQQSSPDVAVVDAVLDGKLVSLGVDETGHGYTSTPTLTLSGGGGGGAEAEAVISGPIRDFSLLGGGSGYKAPPKVVFSNAGSRASAASSVSGFVSSLVIADGGDGYRDKPSAVITGGGGTGATAEAVMLKRVAFIRIESRSGLFKMPPTVSFVGGGATETAEAEAVCQYIESIDRYYVSSIRVTSKGQGYTGAPEVTVSQEVDQDGSVSSVNASATMDQYVSSVTLTSGGGGYSSPPGIMLFGQSNTQAKVFALLSMSVSGLSLSSAGQYRSAPSISFDPSGTFQSISLASAGSGYKTPPRVVVVDTRGLGDGGSAACKINKSGSVTEIFVTAVGSGYDVEFPPAIVFVGGGGSGASASASVEKSGSGASASCRLNASILYAKVKSPGSGYQFSPKVAISGGGNLDVSGANDMFQGGLISAEERDSRVESATGQIQARIEGPISRFDIINPGNFYSSSFADNGYGYPVSEDITCVPSFSHVVGNRRINVNFNAPSTRPGGPISQPLAMPTQKFCQKPKVLFSNSQDVDVEVFKQAIETSVGTRQILTLPAAGTFGDYGYSGLGPRLKNNLIFNWSDHSGGRRRGWSGLYFEQGKFPEVIFSSESGVGMTASATLDESGAVQSVSISNAAGGYNVRRTRIDLSGGILRHVPCVASCTVSGDGRISSVTVSNGGSGYISPAVIIHDGCGQGALATAASSGGIIQSISISSSGSEYSSSRPPVVLVYETSGYFSESQTGVSFRDTLSRGFSDWSQSDYPIAWDSYQTEYSLPIAHTSTSDVKSANWGGPQTSTDQRLQNIDSFGYLTEAVSLTSNKWIETGQFSTLARSAPPSVSVQGDCDRSIEVSSEIVKWKDVFANNGGSGNLNDVCGIRDTT